MGFLAYLLVGGIVGAAASYYFPGFSPRNKGTKRAKRSKATYLWSMAFGILGTAFASFGGQAAGLFTAGQMLEWGSAIAGGFLLPQVYLLSVRA